mgnify:CR=1 FL=1
MTRLAAIAAFSLIAGVAGAQEIARRGYVTDAADALSPGDETRLVELLAAIERRTGYDVAVVALARAPGGLGALADSLFPRWNQGNLGLVLLVAIEDREYWFAAATQLESFFSATYRDELAERCFRPHFREGRHGEGLIRAVEDFSPRLPRLGEEAREPSEPSPAGTPRRSSPYRGGPAPERSRPRESESWPSSSPNFDSSGPSGSACLFFGVVLVVFVLGIVLRGAGWSAAGSAWRASSPGWGIGFRHCHRHRSISSGFGGGSSRSSSSSSGFGSGIGRSSSSSSSSRSGGRTTFRGGGGGGKW